MAVIHVLDKHTAELIAAGEVVERPASVAKELLENAIDAGATQITLSVTRGGIQQLQVTDNGSGIETESIGKAFIRHATSKIATEEDLGHIHTLGFRGEALASIASVARVEVLTRTEQDEYACCYRIDGGEEQGMEPGARPVGTTITVNELFYNTPARMKFLKKDVSEGTFVADTILHAALSHPEISFRFVREGKQQFVTPGDGVLRSAAYAALGREFARDLLPAEGGSGLYAVTGLITPPRACKASRASQYFYVNGRYVKNRTMMAALENAYKGTLMGGKFPGAILMLTMPAELVDVNVHPAKTEIRFARENDVFDAVYRTVRAALAAPGSGECRFTVGHAAPGAAETDAAETDAAGPAGPAIPASPRPVQHFNTLSAAEYRALQKLAGPVGARALPGGKSASGTAEILAARRGGYPSASLAGGLPLRQEHAAYAVPAPDALPGGEPCAGDAPPAVRSFAPADAAEQGLDLLPDLPEAGTPPEQDGPFAAGAPSSGLPGAEDPLLAAGAAEEPPQAAADDANEIPLSALPAPEQTSLLPAGAEPLRYVGEVFRTYIMTERGSELCLIDKHAAHERLLFEELARNYGGVASQLLLVPVQVNLSAEEKQAVLQNLPLLADAGVEAEDYGGSTVIVRSVPADVAVDDVEDMLVELAAHLAAGGRDALREKTEWVLHSIACRAAIKAGDKTDPTQLLALATRILDGTVPPFCPHGRPCVLKITRKELEKQFGRLV